MHLVHDLLDKQVYDKRGASIGRVDGVSIELRAGRPPRVRDVHIGAHVLADRLHPRGKRWTHWIRAWWRAGEAPPTRIPVRELRRHGTQWAADEIDARDTPALAWELWLRTNVIARIPLGGR